MNAHRYGWWLPLALAAAWIAVVLLAGCSSQRLPDDARADITLAAQGAGADIRHAEATSRPQAAFAPLLAGYRSTLRLLCARLAVDAHDGRGWIEWAVGASGLTSGPSGELDADTAQACEEAKP